MLTDSALQNLRPRSKIYKVTDRDGMYVVVATSGTITFEGKDLGKMQPHHVVEAGLVQVPEGA